MREAQVRDAIHCRKFYFRKSLLPEDEGDDEEAPPTTTTATGGAVSHDHEYTLMTIDTIINGKVFSYYNTLTCMHVHVHVLLQEHIINNFQWL